MTYLEMDPTTVPEQSPSIRPEPTVRDREGTLMLLHEALARSRQQEAQRAARDHALARSVTAGRRWARLARFATRRAERARTGVAPAVPSDTR